MSEVPIVCSQGHVLIQFFSPVGCDTRAVDCWGFPCNSDWLNHYEAHSSWNPAFVTSTAFLQICLQRTELPCAMLQPGHIHSCKAALHSDDNLSLFLFKLTSHSKAQQTSVCHSQSQHFSTSHECACTCTHRL